MRYRMEGATVLTLDGEDRVFAPGQLTWEDDHIVSVGALDSDPSPVDQLIHVPDAVVLPGFLNGHNHAAMSLMRGLADDQSLLPWLYDHIFPVEARLTGEDVYVGTLLAAAEMLRSGTVGFADMYFHADQVARAVEVSGLRGWVGRGLASGEKAFDHLAEAVDFGRRWRGRGDGRVVPMLGPHAPYTLDDAFTRAIATAAHDEGLAIHIHLAESPQEVEDLARSGTRPVSWARARGLLDGRVLIAHGTQITDRDLPALSGLVGGVIACPVSNAKLGNGIMPYPLLAAAGIAVGLGTDGAASTNSLDMFLEMKMMAWLQKLRAGRPDAFSARDAVRLATEGTAAVLGHPGGQLAPGRPADFIAVGSDPPHLNPWHDWVSNLVYAASGADVRYTVVAGRILLAEGMITSFDEREVVREARGRARRLVEG